MSNDIQHKSFWKSTVANEPKSLYVTKKQVMESKSKLFFKGFIFAVVCCVIGAALGLSFFYCLHYSPAGTTIGVALLAIGGLTYIKYQEYTNQSHKDNENSK